MIKPPRLHLTLSVIALVSVMITQRLAAEPNTFLGNKGHYLNICKTCYLNNPTGNAFTVTLYRFQWWIGKGWNVPDFNVSITGPDKEVVFKQTVTIPDDGYTIRIKQGKKGVYTVNVDSRNSLNYWFLTTSLTQAVAYTGDGRGTALTQGWLVLNPFVPRTWYFFVPEGTKTFTLWAQNNQGRSQREDHGITVFSPRGQRMAVLWGQAGPEAKPETIHDDDKQAFRYQKAVIFPEPGSDGRFWAIQFRMGDSHPYSDVNIHLSGIPPYLAQSPEAYFDPDTGKRPKLSLYDDDDFVQSDRSDASRAKFPLHQHWTPCPAIGDPDGCEIRCPSTIAFWNPEQQETKLVIGTYLPRNMFPAKGSQSSQAPTEKADIVLVDNAGKTVIAETIPLEHLHGQKHKGWRKTIPPSKGVSYLTVRNGEHFWAYTYPAMPSVLVGQATKDHWTRFQIEAGTARNWYFFVPKGTKTFSVRFEAADQSDIVHLQVCSPDRTVALFYANKGAKTISVPTGLDGTIWHIRPDWGSSSEPFGKRPRPRFPSIILTLDLKSVPGYLAPTWEQWFNPKNPKRPWNRTRADN